MHHYCLGSQLLPHHIRYSLPTINIDMTSQVRTIRDLHDTRYGDMGVCWGNLFLPILVLLKCPRDRITAQGHGAVAMC